jgi:polar amino acid transport system substrate-binding protein
MSKNLITIFVVLILVFSVGLVIAADDSLQKIKEEGRFVLGLDDNFPPMGFRDESGNIVGFDIDLAKEVANRMGVEVELKPVEWDGMGICLTKVTTRYSI